MIVYVDTVVYRGISMLWAYDFYGICRNYATTVKPQTIADRWQVTHGLMQGAITAPRYLRELWEDTRDIHLVISQNGGTPVAGWFISWRILLKWMIWELPPF